ncbi:MAG: DNRLRE domain-containing protein [Dehalococcoidia bacterium]|jgi:hypothetical protein
MVTDEKKIPDGGQEAPRGSAAPGGAKPAPPKKGGGFPKWAIWLIVVVVILVIAGIAVGVVLALTGGEENQAPSIASLTADPDNLIPGEGTTVTCVADDPDGDTLTYAWTANGGAISGTGATVTWIAPLLAKGYIIEVTVDDGNGGTDDDSVAIVVGIAPTPTPTPTPTSTPAPSDGSIDIQSNPAGASIYIDGVDTGSITPYVAMHIPEGNHIIKMEYPYYEWHIGTVTVVGGETAYINWALDPSTIQTATIQPDAAAGKDSYVYELSPGSNWGTGSYIFTSGDAVGSLLRVYVQFDLSSIPSSAVVTDAKLGLSYETKSGGAFAGPVGVYRVVAPWDEATITWDTQPAVAASVEATATIPAVVTNAFIYWDLDDLVQGWISGLFANRGMTLKDTDETTFEGYKGFFSSDWGTLANTPKLTIQYYDPAP